MREYIQQHPELNMTQGDIVKSTLTKAERHLKDKSDGRPDKPPPWVTATNTLLTHLREGIFVGHCPCEIFGFNMWCLNAFRNGYSMFCAELMSSMKDVPSTERMVMCSQRWKLLKQGEKDAYQKRCEQVTWESWITERKKSINKASLSKLSLFLSFFFLSEEKRVWNWDEQISQCKSQTLFTCFVFTGSVSYVWFICCASVEYIRGGAAAGLGWGEDWF